MRICHVIEAFGGGCAQVAIDLVRHGIAMGDQITVIYAPGRAEPKYVAALNGFSGVTVRNASMKKKVGLHDIVDALNLLAILQETGPFDIMHAHSSKAGALLRLIGWRLPGKIVYTPHAFYSMRMGASSIYGTIERFLSWFGTAVVAVSSGEYRHAQHLGISSSKLFLIPNGTAVSFTKSRDEVRRALGAEESHILFGFVGRFEIQKNPVRAVSAFAKIAENFPAARLYMVGDGKLRPQVEAMIKDLNLQGTVHLLGYCEARTIIPGLDCLLGSSEFEASPITFLESLTSGVPIITTPVGGSEEAVVEGKTGYVAQGFSDEALAHAMGKYLGLPLEERQQMAIYALQHSKLSSAESMGDKYRSLYQGLLSSKSESSSRQTPVASRQTPIKNQQTSLESQS